MTKTILVLILLVGIACSNNGNNNLEVTARPANPVLIPAGSDTTINTFKITPPYFAMTALSLLWKGKGTVNIVAIQLDNLVIQGTEGGTNTNATKVKCAFSGDDLKLIFPNNINATTGAIEIAEGASAVTSRNFGCGGIALPTPLPSVFNIPVNIKITGAIQDGSNPSNTTGRAIGTAIINVQ